MANRFNEIQELVLSLEADFKKFYEQGNKAAGTRVRKGMLDLKNVAQSIRLHVQELKNTEEAAEAAKAKTPAKAPKAPAKEKKKK
jgi:Histone H1-like protein Hc1